MIVYAWNIFPWIYSAVNAISPQSAGQGFPLFLHSWIKMCADATRFIVQRRAPIYIYASRTRMASCLEENARVPLHLVICFQIDLHTEELPGLWKINACIVPCDPDLCGIRLKRSLMVNRNKPLNNCLSPVVRRKTGSGCGLFFSLWLVNLVNLLKRFFFWSSFYLLNFQLSWFFFREPPPLPLSLELHILYIMNHSTSEHNSFSVMQYLLRIHIIFTRQVSSISQPWAGVPGIFF